LILAVGLLCGAAAVYAWLEVSASNSGDASTVKLCGRWVQQTCVIDGDTIRYGGVKIRLSDIDTPEISSPKCASEAALGHRAKERLVALMNAGPFEVVQRGSRDEDRYGRKLRVIERAGRSLGETLVAEGFGSALGRCPTQLVLRGTRLHQTARTFGERRARPAEAGLAVADATLSRSDTLARVPPRRT
jgi:hypothetical protein